MDDFFTEHMHSHIKRLILFVLLIVAAMSAFSQQKPDALKMYQAGQYKDAIEVCLNEIEFNPNNMDSYVVLTWALIADGQYAKVIDYCKRAKNISEYDPRILFSEGEANYFLGNNLAAINDFEQYIVYAPNGNRLASVYYYFGEIYLRLKKFQHADIAFTTAVQLKQNDAKCWERLAYAREQSRSYTFALEAYEKALALNKNLIDAQEGRTRVLNRLQR